MGVWAGQQGHQSWPVPTSSSTFPPPCDPVPVLLGCPSPPISARTLGQALTVCLAHGRGPPGEDCNPAAVWWDL